MSLNKFDLINSIINDIDNNKLIPNQSDYISVDIKQRYVLNKLVQNHLLSDLNQFINEYLEPEIIWVHVNDIEKRKIYDKYDLFTNVTISMIRFSIIDKKLNGVIKIFCDPGYILNKETLGAETKTFEDKEYKIYSTRYYLNNKLHRDDGAAIESANGHKIWYQHDEIHLTNGPALNQGDDKDWYFNGKLHREDGPALNRNYGYKEWHIHGKHHREDGPATIYPDYNNFKKYYLVGNLIHSEQFNDAVVKYSDKKIDIN